MAYISFSDSLSDILSGADVFSGDLSGIQSGNYFDMQIGITGQVSTCLLLCFRGCLCMEFAVVLWCLCLGRCVLACHAVRVCVPSSLSLVSLPRDLCLRVPNQSFFL